MRSKGRVVAAVALAAGMLLGTVQAAPKIGEAPPDLLGKARDGTEVRISERRGKVLVVGFWASWCGYCRKQYPMLESFQQQVGPERMETIVVNFQEPVPTFRALMRQLRDSSLTWIHDRDGSVSGAYDVKGVPRLYVVDASGILAYTQDGYGEQSAARLAEVLNRLVADAAPAPAAATDGESPAGGMR